jgi:ABC-type antimicrobial peptide transport system ATPase subunit
VPSTTTVETNSKKKFVFRIKTSQGAEYLLQADDAPSFSNWVTAIQRLNDGQNIPNDSFTSVLTRPESSNKLAAPNSPLMQRRSSSPQPQKAGGKKRGMVE